MLEVFHRLCVPLPQREYKQSRRGKELSEMRLKQESMRQKSRPQTEENSGASSSYHISFVNSCTGKDRLKPPPDLTQNKKIRLSTSSSSGSCINGSRSSLDRIVIKDKSSDIKNELNDGQKNQDGVKTVENAVAKKIKLKRPVIEVNEKEQTTVPEEPKPKKVRQKISWP